MAPTPSTRPTDRLPFPAEALPKLRKALARLTPAVTLNGWHEAAPLLVSPPPGEGVAGAWFDVDAVVRKIDALTRLRHVKGGRYGGKPFVPDPWQIVWVLAPIFGWRYALDDPDEERAGQRIVRSAYVEVPRKNGKSTLASGITLLLLAADGEHSPEVYAAAWGRDQARQVFDPASSMATASPDLKDKLEVLRNIIRHPANGGFYRVLSRAADVAHGLNVSGAVIDELHVHRNRHLVDAIETGVGARSQPLVVIITTADEGDVGTIYDERRNYAELLANRVVTDSSTFVAVYAAPDDADPWADATIRKANPGLGRSLTWQAVRDERTKARNNASLRPTYLRLRLNRRVRNTVRWLNLGRWDDPRNSDELWLPDQAQPLADWAVPRELLGRVAWAGLDLSATTDLTALTLWLPDTNLYGSGGWVLPFFWLPDADLADRVERDRIPYDRWAEDGWLRLTDGNVVDYSEVVAVVEWAASTFDLRRVSHDRWQAGPVIQHLTAAGVDSNPVPQTFAGMSAPAKRLEELVLEGGFRHQGHPVLRWNAAVVDAKTDVAANLRPVKPNRQLSSSRVDGITASVMALDGAIRAEELPPVATAPARAPSSSGGIFRPDGPLRL